MTHASNIRERLDRIANADDFRAVSRSLAQWQSSEVYEALFPLAISGREGAAPWYAGCLLIDLQPDCPEPPLDMIARVHASKWFVSFREVPFYLVTQFGKRTVLDAAAHLLRRWTRARPSRRVCSHWSIGLVCPHPTCASISIIGKSTNSTRTKRTMHSPSSMTYSIATLLSQVRESGCIVSDI